MSKYKLVPVEPTPDMLAAGHYAIEAGRHPSGVYADMLAAAPTTHGPLTLSDEKILEIASNPMVTPCSPWWIKDDVKAGDVQNAAFARAVLKTAAPAVQQPAPGVAQLVEACRNELMWMIERYNQQDQSDGSWLYDYQTVAEADAALAAHHNQGGEQ